MAFWRNIMHDSGAYRMESRAADPGKQDDKDKDINIGTPAYDAGKKSTG